MLKDKIDLVLFQVVVGCGARLDLVMEDVFESDHVWVLQSLQDQDLSNELDWETFMARVKFQKFERLIGGVSLVSRVYCYLSPQLGLVDFAIGAFTDDLRVVFEARRGLLGLGEEVSSCHLMKI